MRLNVLNSAVKIRLKSGKAIQLSEPMTSIATSADGALRIDFPNGSSAIYSPAVREKITTTHRDIKNRAITSLFRSDKTK
jgi:hypothetical protein